MIFRDSRRVEDWHGKLSDICFSLSKSLHEFNSQSMRGSRFSCTFCMYRMLCVLSCESLSQRDFAKRDTSSPSLSMHFFERCRSFFFVSQVTQLTNDFSPYSTTTCFCLLSPCLSGGLTSFRHRYTIDEYGEWGRDKSFSLSTPTLLFIISPSLSFGEGMCRLCRTKR